jgi:hypothetical protein
MAGRQFIGRYSRDIDVRETLDIATFFIDSRKPKIPVRQGTQSLRTAPSR